MTDNVIVFSSEDSQGLRDLVKDLESLERAAQLLNNISQTLSADPSAEAELEIAYRETKCLKQRAISKITTFLKEKVV